MDHPARHSSPLVRSPADIGRLARARRREQQLTIADFAPLVGLGERFVSEAERGKGSAEIGKVLAMLEGLGLSVLVLPKATAAKLAQQVASEPAEPGAGR